MPSEASVLLYGWRSNHPVWRNQVRHKILVLDLDLNFKYLFIFQLNCHHLSIICIFTSLPNILCVLYSLTHSLIQKEMHVIKVCPDVHVMTQCNRHMDVRVNMMETLYRC